MAQRYWVLLERDDASQQWGITFGDFSRSVVADERMAYRDAGTKASNLRVIMVPNATQANINSAVAELNRASLSANTMLCNAPSIA